MNLGLIQNFTANGPIQKLRIVAFGAAEGEAVQATGDAAYLGTSGVRGAEDQGKRIDVNMDNIRDLDFGGAVAYGDWLTSDANGKAVVAAPADGVQMNVIGRALNAGVDGSYGKVHVNPQQITG